MDDKDEISVVILSDEEWQAKADEALNDLGITYDELKRQAAERNFMSIAARKLWLIIGD